MISKSDATLPINESLTHVCKGCGTTFNDNYCNHCGQKIIERFSLRYFWRLLHADLLEIDRGWWLTFKDLTLRPGPTIEAYLKGDTKRYFSPVKYLLIVSGLIYLWISIEKTFDSDNYSISFESWRANMLSNETPAFSKASLVEIINAFPLIMDGNIVILWSTVLMFVAFAGTLIFRNLNFTELIITWIYLWAQLFHYILALTLLTLPVELFDSESQIDSIVMPLGLFAMFYFLTKTFRHLTSGKWFMSFLKVIFSMYGGFLTFLVVIWLILGFVKVIYILF